MSNALHIRHTLKTSTNKNSVFRFHRTTENDLRCMVEGKRSIYEMQFALHSNIICPGVLFMHAFSLPAYNFVNPCMMPNNWLRWTQFSLRTTKVIRVDADKLTHFEFASAWVRHHFAWSLFCWAYEQMLDVHCHRAPGGTFADTSPVVAVEYNAAVVAYTHMQVMADQRFSGENCKYKEENEL